jgi:tetrahydromethanopterin S-methyltransferase subunit B
MIGLSLLEQWGPRLWENWKATWIAPMYAEWDALVVKAGDAWAGFKAEFWDPLEKTFNLVMTYGPMIFSEWKAGFFNKISEEIASLQTQVSEMLGSVTFNKISEEIASLQTQVSEMLGSVTGAIDRLVTRSQEKLAGIWTAFSMAGSSAVDSIKTYLDGLIPFVTFDELVSMATDTAYNQMADVINPFITAYNSFPLTDDISLMATRAEGGPVIGGQPYIVGEKGPEVFTPGSSGAIIPNDQLGGGGGEQTITMNINVGGVTDRTDKRALAREIGDLLTQELRRQGGAPTRGRF